ncbi:MAG: arginine repressor [Actinobacteria bacterium]|nr:arginine repressor [Actinomycetota bacterium]
MNKHQRLKIIRDIISSGKISSQQELQVELEKKGVNVTQSTISRDIASLNLIKVRDSDRQEYYAIKSSYLSDPQYGIQKIKSKFKESVLSFDRANNIIVLKTNPGEAQGIAAVIDGVNFVEVLGTVAGDDTIICIVKNNEKAEKLIKLFNTFS